MIKKGEYYSNIDKILMAHYMKRNKQKYHLCNELNIMV